jgi:TP901 family phage tail tape measure protein
MAAKSLTIQIRGDAKDFKVAVDGMEASLDSVDTKIGKSNQGFDGMAGKLKGLGAAAGIGLAAVGGAAVGAGAALYSIGSEFDDAADTIRVQTGATGAALDGLNTSFKNVVSNVPASFGDASGAIAGLNQSLGLTGAPLEAISTQLLNLSRITDTDVNENVKASAELFNNWGVAAGDQGAKLDELYRLSQASGVSVGQLSKDLSENGVALRATGFELEDAAALFGTLGKAGLGVGDIMPALQKAMAAAAKDGKDAGAVVESTFHNIKAAGSDAEAAGAAVEVFGAKAGPKLAALIREGKLSVDDMAKAIYGGTDTINGAAADTADFSEKWGLFANKLKVAVEPIATKVFTAVGDAMDKLGPVAEQVGAWLSENLPKAFAMLGDAWDAVAPMLMTGAEKLKDAAVTAFAGIRVAVEWLGDHREILVGIATVIGVALVGAVVAYGIAMAQAAIATIAATWPLIAIGAAIGVVVAAVLWAWNNWTGFHDFIVAAMGWIQTNVPPVWEAFKLSIQMVVDFLVNTAWPIMQTIFHAIAEVALWLWNWAIRPAFEGIKLIIEGVAWYVSSVVVPIYSKAWEIISAGVTWLWHTIIEPTWNGIRDSILVVANFVTNTVLPIWVNFWNSLTGGIREVGEKIGAGMQGIKDVINGVASWISGIGSGFWNGLTGSFRTAINFVIDKWNSLSFNTPDVPGTDWGGQHLAAPYVHPIHTGGTFFATQPGGVGLALLRDREVVSTPGRGGGGDSLISAVIELTKRVDDLASRPVQVVVDGRVLAEATTTALGRRQAAMV